MASNGRHAWHEQRRLAGAPLAVVAAVGVAVRAGWHIQERGWHDGALAFLRIVPHRSRLGLDALEAVGFARAHNGRSWTWSDGA